MRGVGNVPMDARLAPPGRNIVADPSSHHFHLPPLHMIATGNGQDK